MFVAWDRVSEKLQRDRQARRDEVTSRQLEELKAKKKKDFIDSSRKIGRESVRKSRRRSEKPEYTAAKLML